MYRSQNRRSMDFEREAQVLQWMEEMLGQRIFPTDKITDRLLVLEPLRDGVMLCKLFNSICKTYQITNISTQKLPFKMMDNINKFITACKSIGMGEEHIPFTPLELFAKRNDVLHKVATCLQALREYHEKGPQALQKRQQQRYRFSSADSPQSPSKGPITSTHDNAEARLAPELANLKLPEESEQPLSDTHTMLVELPNIKLDNVVARMVAQNSEPLSSSIGSDLDDWETDPNYRNTNIIVPRVSNDLESQSHVAFGVKRGKCLAEDCPCDLYRALGELGQGGPCQNCGHYPVKHEDLGRDEFATISTEIANFIIKPEQLHYEFKIGEGGFGEVWKGTLWGKEIAIKTLKNAIGFTNKKRMIEFLKEIKVMASLRHPNVLLWIGACLEPPIIVTELLERGSLLDVLNHSPTLAWHTRLKMALDACLGVNYLHNLDIIHCDLKSSNLLVDINFNVKVGDFGLSRVARANMETVLSDGLYGGTVAYMAPEVLEAMGRFGTKKSDVYSLGIILWEIASGKKAFADKDSNSMSIMRLVVHQKERPPIDSSWPSDYVALMQACWDSDPDNRPTVEEIIVQLRAMLKQAMKQEQNSKPTL